MLGALADGGAAEGRRGSCWGLRPLLRPSLSAMPGDLDDLLSSAPDLREASSLPAHARIEQWLMASIDDGSLVAGDQLAARGGTRCPRSASAG